MAGGGGEGNGSSGWGERQGTTRWKKEGRMKRKGSAGNCSGRRSGKKERGWTGRGAGGCWSGTVEG